MSETIQVNKNEFEQFQKDHKELVAQMGSLVKTMNSPNFGGRIRVDDEGRPVAWVESTSEQVYVERDPSTREERRKHMQGGIRKSYEDIRRGGYKPRETFKSFGEFINLGFRNQDEFRKRHIESMGRIKAISGLSTVSGSDGGWLVMPEFSTKIFERVYENDLLSRTDQYTVSGNNMSFPKSAETSRANGSRAGGIRGYWTGQGVTRTASQPKMDRLTLNLKKLCVLVYLTDELIDDAGNGAEAWVQRSAEREFNFMIGDALVNGTGGNMPLGMLQAPALLSVSAESGQAATTIIAENVDNMWMRRYAGSDRSYIWLKNQDTSAQLDQLSQGVGTGGSVLYRRPDGLASEGYSTLKGADCIDTEFNATLGTVGDLLLCDMGQIVTITKGGIEQAVSTHVEFLTDQTALKFTMRLDAAPWEDSPITPFKGSNTQSSFVALATRS